MNNHLVMLCVLGTTFVFSGCGGREVSGPPELKLGHHECAECGMLINDERCSAAMIVDRGRGREYVMFDDIGCALDYEADNAPEQKVLERFFHDHTSKQWIVSGPPVFVYADREKLQTPMGSGIAAFATRSGAELVQREATGDVIEFASLVSARRAWLEAHFGKTDSPR